MTVKSQVICRARCQLTSYKVKAEREITFFPLRGLREAAVGRAVLAGCTCALAGAPAGFVKVSGARGGMTGRCHLHNLVLAEAQKSLTLLPPPPWAEAAWLGQENCDSALGTVPPRGWRSTLQREREKTAPCFLKLGPPCWCQQPGR